MIKVITRPVIKLKQLEYNYNNTTLSDDSAQHYGDTFGKYPFVQLGNTVIQSDDTIKLTLYNNQFVPKLEIQFKDPTYRIIDPLFPTDNTIISVFIRSTNDTLMFIRMDFKVTNIVADKGKDGDNQERIFTITGLLDVDYIYYSEFTSYPQSTTFDILQKIASKAKLGFATNINNTNDQMTWINPGESNLEFIQEIIKYSYGSDQSYMYAYIDFYYNLNYVDIENSLNEDISNQQGITESSAILNNSNTKQNTKYVPLILTDHPNSSSSNRYINRNNIINSSTATNLNIGYKTSVAYYDQLGNTYYKLMMDTISTQGTTGDQVILKGNVGEISNLTTNVIDNVSLGRIDTDNVHANFLYAYEQNLKNIEYLQKVKMVVTLNVMNFNVYRFQKLTVNFYKIHQLNDKPVNIKNQNINDSSFTQQDFDADKLNQRLSGDWLITAINYTFNQQSGFNQEITIVRRELGFNNEDFNSTTQDTKSAN